jgi:hypothetical protein
MSATNFDRYDLANADNLTTERMNDNVREDLTDVITNIAPTQTPFQSGIGSGSTSNTRFDWLIDDLGAVDGANARIDGADAGDDTSSAAVRVSNHCQISDKPIKVSGRAETVNKAGRRRESAYQLMKAGKALKRDVETIITGNQGSLAGDSATAGLTGSLRAWIETNVELDATSGANGGYNATTGVVDAATDSSATQALSMSDIDSVILGCYNEGGEPDTIMVSPAVKSKLSDFLFTSSARIATLQREAAGGGQATAVGAVDVYISDFGTLKIIPNRFQRDRDVFVLDMSLWRLDYLRRYRTNKLAKTGDAENRQLLVDYGLRSWNEAGSGVVADVDHTADVVA